MPNESTDTYLKNNLQSFKKRYYDFDIFFSDSDSNKEALQEENCEEDGSVEGEVGRNVPPQGTIKSCCFTYINFSKYQIYYLPNGSTETYRIYPKYILQSFKKLYHDVDGFCFRF